MFSREFYSFLESVLAELFWVTASDFDNFLDEVFRIHI